MNDIFERLKSLLGDYNAFDENGIGNAEIYAYSKGIKLIKEKISQFEEKVSVQNPDSICDMLKINTSLYSYEELLSLIKDRLSRGFTDYLFSDIFSAFERVGSGNLEISENAFIITGVKGENLVELGKFIKSFVPCFFHVFSSSTGMTFDEWDSLNFTFGEYDSFDLPFEYIESIRREDIEQY